MMLAIASMATGAMAQEKVANDKCCNAKSSRYETSFWSNWFVSADLSGEAFYTNEDKTNGFSKSPFKGFRNNLGFSVAVGKWFTPGMGLRTKFNGIWGRNVQTEDASTNAIKFWNIQEQVLFNLNNMFGGYNENRIWNIIPYAGFGVLRNMSDNLYADNFSLGLINTFKVADRLKLNLDLGFYFANDYDAFRPANNRVLNNYGSGLSKSDRYYAVEVGLTYDLGKPTFNSKPKKSVLEELYRNDAAQKAQIASLNAQVEQKNQENQMLAQSLKEQKAAAEAAAAQPKVMKEVVTAPISVFFKSGTTISPRTDIQDVKELAEIAKANGSKVVVTGYADSKTGTAKLNQTLSEKRAKKIADELVKLGVDSNNIEVVAAGGVDNLKPYSFNRRATIELK